MGADMRVARTRRISGSWKYGVSVLRMAALGSLMLGYPAAPVLAQEPRRVMSVYDLPRPGYETGKWRVGNTTFYPVLTTAAVYDSNLFATRENPDSAIQFQVAPRIEATSQGRRLNLESDIYVDARLHSRFTSEDHVTFGLGTAARYAAGRGSTLSGGFRFDRGADRRSDPENSPDLTSPALYNSISADLGYGYKGGRWSISVRGGAQWVNYLASGEADPDIQAQLEDRDIATYLLPVRLTLIASPRLGIFIEPYVNRRDARRPVDRSGIDRDSTTVGVLTGVSLDIADRWKGEIGAGAFRNNPDDASLNAFSGFAMNGNLQWSPAQRTVITFSAFQGDVATIRSGANGRIDTRLGARIEQEIRHNLLANAGIGYRRTSYRGALDSKLTSVAGDAEIEWLVSRTLSVFARVSHEKRTATLPTDAFNRTTAGIGIRLRT